MSHYLSFLGVGSTDCPALAQAPPSPWELSEGTFWLGTATVFLLQSETVNNPFTPDRLIRMGLGHSIGDFPMPKLAITAAAFAALAIAAPATAAVTISSTPGSATYTGPTPTYNFDSGRPANVTGGAVVTGTTSSHAQPLGSTGGYFSVGPADGSPGNIDLSSFGQIFNLTFIWGSVDAYNTLQLIGASNNVLYTFTGADVFNPANGNQTAAGTNPLVQILLTGADVTAVRGLRLSSTQNAFELDNLAVNAVPEPATWALMLMGFGAVGYSMRRGRRATPRLSALA